jgi:hypothetical protein
MNNGRGPGAPPNDNSALSLLVNAVDSRDGGRRDSGGGSNQGRSLAETLRLQGMSGHGGDTGPSLEEQLLMYQQQQQQQAQQQQHHAYGGHQAQSGLFSQIRDQRNMFSQLGQQQQLANLLGLGGGGGGGGGSNPNDMRAALAAQLRQSQSQAPQFTQADLLALSRSGALQGILGGGGGHGGGGGGGGSNQYASEIEGMQRLEELERRQRLLAASKNAAGRPMDAEMYRPEPAPEPRMPRPPDKQQYPPRPSAIKLEADEPVAPPMAESNKEEVEKAPGSVIVPCRARGMPMDHNFKVRPLDYLR